MKQIDFYTGFEGNPEIVISVINDDQDKVYALKTWVGYFDAVLQKIKPLNGHWEGVALHYHLETGWYDEEWTCDNVKLLHDQLKEIEKSEFDELELKFYHELVKLSDFALKNEMQITITCN